MKKRLLSLVLCLAVLLPTLVLFTSCGSEEEDTTGQIPPMTIVIAMMTDEKTNEKGIEATEKVLNQIAESNLNTHIELKLYTEEEYYAKLEETLLARYRAKENGDKSTSIGDVKDVTFDEEKNREVTAYPKPYKDQIDIFYVDSKVKLEQYRYWPAEGYTFADFEAKPLDTPTYQLVSILEDSMLNDSAPLLKKYLSTGLLDAGKVYQQGVGELCAIPSNSIYEEAEYMLIDKKYFDESAYNIEEVSGILSLENFMIDFVEQHPDVQPIYNMGSMGFVSLTGKNSVISQYVPDGSKPENVGLEPKTLLGAASFKSMLVSMNKYLPKSQVTADPTTGSVIPEDRLNNGSFAVGFVTADPYEIEAYKENYYVIESSKARINEQQACGNMFAISEFTSDANRCLEVINMIQTNKEFHNTLVYGVENVTYTVNQTTGLIDRVKQGNTIYLMDIHRTGNLFITEPNSEMSDLELQYAANDWALAKETARHAMFSPYIGFRLEVFQGDEIFDDPNTKENESNNKLNLPTLKEIDFMEEQYYWLLEQVFKFDEAVDAETGEPLFETYALYLDSLDATLRSKLLPEHQAIVDAEAETEAPAVIAEGEETETTEPPVSGEPTTGEPTTGEDVPEEPKSIEYPKVIGSQLVATAGMKNVYRQFLDWRKVRFITAS